MQLAALAVATLFAASCGGNIASRPSSAQLQAINHNQRGIRLETQGEHERALEEFGAALRLNAAIDNRDGTMVALVNSARVHRLRGNLNEARAHIDRAIKMASPGSEIYAEASFEKALISLASDNPDEALKWASAALDADKGENRGGRLNLIARITFQRGNVEEARQMLGEALKFNQEKGKRAEEANSHRLLGDIHSALKRPQEAIISYGKALTIDKELGKSTKIADDLRGLAGQSVAAGDTGQGERYWLRAFEVSTNGGDLRGAAGDLLEIARLLAEKGDKPGAEQLLADHDRMLKSLERAGEPVPWISP
jgi:tetratricopeptide (TPR) repeat protein